MHRIGVTGAASPVSVSRWTSVHSPGCRPGTSTITSPEGGDLLSLRAGPRRRRDFRARSLTRLPYPAGDGGFHLCELTKVSARRLGGEVSAGHAVRLSYLWLLYG